MTNLDQSDPPIITQQGPCSNRSALSWKLYIMYVLSFEYNWKSNTDLYVNLPVHSLKQLFTSDYLMLTFPHPLIPVLIRTWSSVGFSRFFVTRCYKKKLVACWGEKDVFRERSITSFVSGGSHFLLLRFDLLFLPLLLPSWKPLQGISSVYLLIAEDFNAQPLSTRQPVGFGNLSNFVFVFSTCLGHFRCPCFHFQQRRVPDHSDQQ